MTQMIDQPRNDAPADESPGSGVDIKSIFNLLGPLIGLIFVYALFAALRWDKFVSASNTEVMLIQTAIVGTAAIGMTMVIVAGGIDLSVGSMIALVTVVIARMIEHGYSPMVAAIVGVLVSMICGMVSGLLITQLKLLPFIITLGMMSILRGTATYVAGENTIYPDSIGLLSDLMKRVSVKPTWVPQAMYDHLPRWVFLPFGVWLMVGMTILAALMLRYTRFGRHIFAVGSNEQTARLCGVNVALTKVLVYSLCAGLTGLAAVLQFAYLSGGDPTCANGLELNIIAAVVIGGASLTGGQGGVFGAILGALIMKIVENGCTKMGYPNSIQMIVTGSIIIVAVGLDRLRQSRA